MLFNFSWRNMIKMWSLHSGEQRRTWQPKLPNFDLILPDQLPTLGLFQLKHCAQNQTINNINNPQFYLLLFFFKY